MLNDMMMNLLTFLSEKILNGLTETFSGVLTDVMGMAINVLEFDVVQNGIQYIQLLAITILGIKLMFDIFNQYILYQHGEPSDAGGILTRTALSVGVIMSVDWIILQIFTFGNKLASDVGSIDIGSMAWEDVLFVGVTSPILISLGLICFVVMGLIIAVQCAVRGAHLALMAAIAPLMAINVSSENKQMWSAWLREVFILCCSHAIQLFLINCMIAVITTEAVSGGGLLFALGFMISIVKSPKFLKQFMYTSGAGQVGGMAMRNTTTVVNMVKSLK